jgi:hypothetical protein
MESQASLDVSITPLEAFELCAVPVGALFAARVQEETDVVNIFPFLLSVTLLKSPLVINASVFSVSCAAEDEELLLEEDESSPEQAVSAVSEDAINADKSNARSLFLRELLFFLIQPPLVFFA